MRQAKTGRAKTDEANIGRAKRGRWVIAAIVEQAGQIACKATESNVGGRWSRGYRQSCTGSFGKSRQIVDAFPRYDVSFLR